MFFLLFAFWLLLNGQWTAEIAVVGLVLSAALYWFVWRFMGYSPRKEWACLRRAGRIARYFVYLVGEVMKSAWQTIRLVWSPRLEVEPRLTSFRARLRTDPGKVVLANSITMTPGTITIDVRGDQFLVHCLDESSGEGLEGSEMERRIALVEGKGGSTNA